MKFLIPASGPESRTRLESLLLERGLVEGDPFLIVDDSHTAMVAADFLVLASGTASLEALLLRRPMMVGYKLAALTHFIASRLVKIPHVALPNLLAGEELVPEYIQGELSEEAICAEIQSYFCAPQSRNSLLKLFEKIHESLRLNASERAAESICELVAQPS
jgi:lipid-A-disaccharide synthase